VTTVPYGRTAAAAACCDVIGILVGGEDGQTVDGYICSLSMCAFRSYSCVLMNDTAAIDVTRAPERHSCMQLTVTDNL